MHFVVSWDIKAEGEKWKEVNKAMREAIGDYSWVRPLTTFYIIKVNSGNDWNIIQKNLVSIVKKFPEKIHFVMSPLMKGGGYNGWLPKDLWPEIRKRTE
jgi:hypothetical protein